MKKNDSNIRSKFLSIFSIILLIAVICGIGYALIRNEFIGGLNTIRTENQVGIELLESNSEIINLNGAVPISDEQGRESNNYFSFAVISELNAEKDITYNISIEKLEADNGYTEIEDRYVKLYLTDYDDNELELVKANEISSDEYILKTVTNKFSNENSGFKDKYKLRVWIDESILDDANYNFHDINQSLQYKFKIGVDTKIHASTNDIVLTYANNGGSGCGNEVVYERDEYDNLCIPDKTGYTFEGWYTQLNGEEKVEAGDIITNDSDFILYARYEANTYGVALNNNGGTTEGTNSVELTYDSNTLGTITVPSREYTVSGFSLGAERGSDGATVSSTNPVISNYVFEGWYSAVANGEKVIDTTGMLQPSINGYTDENSNWKRASEATLYADWTADSITLPTIEKTNNTCGWTEDSTGEEIEYESGGSYTPNENTTLYGVCQVNDSRVTIQMRYDTTTYTGPSAEYRTEEYETISKTSTQVLVGESETIQVSPAYPDDRYEGAVSCTNGVSATLTEGTGTTTRTDLVTITNNSTNGQNSVCTVTYTPKWEGIGYGSLSSGDTFTYAGEEWTVTSDNGNNVGLALNRSVGTGAYKPDVQEDLANATIDTEALNGGIISQSYSFCPVGGTCVNVMRSAYVTTNSNTGVGLDDSQFFWIGDGYVYNKSNITEYDVDGSTSVQVGYSTTACSSKSAKPLSPTSCSASTYESGVKSVLNTATTMNLKPSSCSGVPTPENYCTRKTEVRMHTDISGYSATSTRAPMKFFRYSATGTSALSNISSQKAGVNTIRILIHGGSAHGSYYLWKTSTATNYKYGLTSAGNTGKYSDTKRWCFAGEANYVTNSAETIRTMTMSSGGYCKTSYSKATLGANTSYDINYRPYLIVRER